jgi:hypothetical protein
MKKLFAVLAIALSGCAAQVTTIDVQGLDRSDRLAAKDLRPASEKDGEIFSLMITSDAYGLYRVADSVVSPAPVRLLQHRAYERFSSAGPAPDLKVHHLVVYRNLQSEFRKAAIASGIGGAIGAAIVAGTVKDASGALSSPVDTGQFNGLAPAEYKRALYTEAENPDRASVHIIYIETEANGKRVFTRTLAPLRTKDGKLAVGEALESAFKYHVSQY